MGKRKRNRRKWATVDEATSKNEWLKRLYLQLETVKQQMGATMYARLMHELHDKLNTEAPDAQEPPRTRCAHSNLVRRLFAVLNTSVGNGKAHGRVNRIAREMSEKVETDTGIEVPDLPSEHAA